MRVSFEKIHVGDTVSRQELASMWGYSGYQALARGVVTPSGDNKIILFVTEEKQSSSMQYKDHLNGDTLYWEGPSDHFAEDRMTRSEVSRDEIHIFYRERHHTKFIYKGIFVLVGYELRGEMPSRFVLKSKP